MQVVILGMSEADTTWCAAKDVPLALIKEYDNQMQIDTVESALQLGGKKTITIQTHVTPQTSALPPEKRQKVATTNKGQTTGYDDQNIFTTVTLFCLVLAQPTKTNT